MHNTQTTNHTQGMLKNRFQLDQEGNVHAILYIHLAV